MVEDDGKRWTITLRDGLKFHDGEPVRARDCVASIRRWGSATPFGQALLARDRRAVAPPTTGRIVFRLKQPFPLLPTRWASRPTTCRCIMPERLAQTDADQAGHRDGRQRALPLQGG